MKQIIKNVCIFASSSSNTDNIYFEDAKLLGKKLAQRGYNIVYGGSDLGLMGAVTVCAKSFGAKITGVMPEKLYNSGINPGECDELMVTRGMRERKAKMDELSDAVVALAGGFGTLEEISEMITQKQLGYNRKPVIFLNTNNFYKELIEFFNKIMDEKFAPADSYKIYRIADTADDVIDCLENYVFEETNFLNKKIALKNQSNV